MVHVNILNLVMIVMVNSLVSLVSQQYLMMDLETGNMKTHGLYLTLMVFHYGMVVQLVGLKEGM